jgi:hypothetical protein
MGVQHIKDNTVIFNSNFELIDVVVEGQKIPTLTDWWNIEYKVPMEVKGVGLEPLSQNENALVVGAPAGTQDSNKTMLLSKKYFKFDPKKIYRISVRAKFRQNVQNFEAGFVGFASIPTNDAYVLNANPIINEVHSVSHYAVSCHNRGLDSFDNTAIDMVNFKVVRENSISMLPNTYRHYEGYVKGYAPDGFLYNNVFLDTKNLSTATRYDATKHYDVMERNYYGNSVNFNNEDIFFDGLLYYNAEGIAMDNTYKVYGRIPQKSLPVSTGVFYISPYIMVNKNSTGIDENETIIDYIMVEEFDTESQITGLPPVNYDWHVTSGPVTWDGMHWNSPEDVVSVLIPDSLILVPQQFVLKFTGGVISFTYKLANNVESTPVNVNSDIPLIISNLGNDYLEHITIKFTGDNNYKSLTDILVIE